MSPWKPPPRRATGGLVLLRQLDEQLGLCARLAPLLVDRRDPRVTQHTRLEQLRQRVFQIVMGYEDQNDATALRRDPVWKVACDRNVDEDDALSSQPSLSRFEHAMTARAVVELTGAFEDEYVATLPADTHEIVLDLDSTEDPTHGQQPLSFFNAHYDSYMYFPLLVFDGEGRLASFRLRPGNAGNSRYAAPLMSRLVRKLKARWGPSFASWCAPMAASARLGSWMRWSGSISNSAPFATSSVCRKTAAFSSCRADGCKKPPTRPVPRGSRLVGSGPSGTRRETGRTSGASS
jgi:hypothetical protein